MEEMTAAINAATSPAVKMWINWMLAVFAISIIFVWKYKGARWVLLAFLLSMPAAYFLFQATKDPWLLGLIHFVLWMPLGIHLIVVELKRTEVRIASIYGVWLVLLLATIAISLVFDFRDVYQVLTGSR
ncbi:MAG: hypothetical protein ACI9UN_000675 [Granulosicoccus sp.]|jgi:hypothetical protein